MVSKRKYEFAPINILLVIFILIGLSMTGCKGKKSKVVVTKFCIPNGFKSVLKFDTTKVERVNNELVLHGKVAFDQDKIIKVFPLAGGIVHEIKVELGDYVKKGDVLAVIQSSDIANLQKDISAAESDVVIARKNMEALKDMFDSGISSEKEYIIAQKDYNKSLSEVRRLQEILKIYGKSDNKSQYYITAAISGFIVEKNINNNTQIRPDNGDYLFVISDMKDVWVIANVYESEISKVELNQAVTVQTLSYPDKIFNAKVDKIYNVLDPDTRAMKIRVKIDNPSYILKPEMFANVNLSFYEHKNLLCIPATSTVFDNNKNYVVVYKDSCDMTVREVELYNTVGNRAYIRYGLKPGERIVSQNQLLLYNALNER